MNKIAFIPAGWMADEIGENSRAYLHLCESGKQMEIMVESPPVQWCEACGFGGLWCKIPGGTDGKKLEKTLANSDSELRKKIDKEYYKWRENPDDFAYYNHEIEVIVGEEIHAAEMYYDEDDEDCVED
jgi:hypothetical protein